MHYLRCFAEDKDYDVFVCYKSGTEEEELYIVRILIPWLEERGFSVCVHYKNFTRNKGRGMLRLNANRQRFFFLTNIHKIIQKFICLPG